MELFERKINAFWERVQNQYHELVTESGTSENMDYHVFQTSYRFKPDLMIVGTNPGGDGRNGNGWLCPPENKNMYIEGEHSWFDRLRQIFDYPNNSVLKTYLENCVGSNKIFLNTGNQDKIPQSKIINGDFIRELVFEIIQPKAIIALGKPSFDVLRTFKEISLKAGNIFSTTSLAKDIPIAYIPNPSSRNNNYFMKGKVYEWSKVIESFMEQISKN